MANLKNTIITLFFVAITTIAIISMLKLATFSLNNCIKNNGSISYCSNL